MHVERWRLDVCLADHHMHLATVMRLVVEEMKHSDGRSLQIILALVVSVGKLPLQKISISLRKEGFDFLVLRGAGGAKLGETVEQNRVQWRCRMSPSGKPRHPDAVPQQHMIQQAVNAAK